MSIFLLLPRVVCSLICIFCTIKCRTAS